MNDEILSALVDGECSPAELDRALEALARDPALQARYSRMYLARDSLRGAAVKPIPAGFAAGVMAALDRKPVSNVMPLRMRRARIWQPLAGLAAAAALATVAVLVLRPASLAPDRATIAAAQPAENTERHWTELDADHARQLKNYLVTHSQSHAHQGVGGTLSHARHAAYAAEPTLQEQPR